MKKLFIAFLVIFVLLLAGIAIKYLFTSFPDNTQQAKQTMSYEGKDCGSEVSSKGHNKGSIDRNCFIEAYKACTPAKISQEVVVPDNHTITTNIYVDGVKKDNNCQVSVHTENKYTFPENDLYYCYKVTLGEADNVGSNTLKLDNCKNRKPLYL